MMSPEAQVSFYLLDIDTSSDLVKLFGITPDGKRVVAHDSNFAPYFYVVPRAGAGLRELHDTLAALSVGDAKVVSATLVEKGCKVFRLVVNKHIYVPAIAAAARKLPEVEDVLEADIRFYRRYLMDKQLTPCTLVKATGERHISEEDYDIIIDIRTITQENTDIAKNLKILAYDIETFSEGNSPDPEKDSIIYASFFGSNGFQKVLTWKRYENPQPYVNFVPGELELLQEFAKTIHQYAPDILVGYGSDSFDLPFIAARAQKYAVELGMNIKASRQGRIETNIVGITHLDISHFIRNILNLETERYKLDVVAREILGKGKLFNLQGAKKISEMWLVGLEEELRALADYNLVDSQLAYELCINLLQTEFELVKLIGLPLRDINRMTYGSLVEWYLVKHAVSQNILIPRKPTSFEINMRARKSYTGAFVVEPKPGFYKNICVFDFRSLYPSIIVSHNISPETRCCDCCKWKSSGKISDAEWFCSSGIGFFPTLIKDLIDRRVRVQAILKQTLPGDPAGSELQARSHALKYIAASFYGYMGFPGSRWYDIECASVVTSLGRKYIQIVQHEAEKMGFDVLYGDTDSLFLQVGDKSESEIGSFLHVVNSTLPAPMELEYRDFYPAGLFLEKKGSAGGAKKRYALLNKNGHLLLRGLEAIRGDWSGLAKKVQRKVLDLVLADGDANRATDYVREIVSKVSNRKVDLSDLIIEVRLTRAIDAYSARGPHVAAAELALAKGDNVGRGYRVKFIIKTGAGKISERVALPENVRHEDYDVDYYVDHQIIRPVVKIFELFNVSEEKLKGGQTTLD